MVVHLLTIKLENLENPVLEDTTQETIFLTREWIGEVSLMIWAITHQGAGTVLVLVVEEMAMEGAGFWTMAQEKCILMSTEEA